MTRLRNLPISAQWALQNYVLELLRAYPGENIHSSRVIPCGFGQFPKFETMILGLKYDAMTGWFSINHDTEE